MFIYVSKSFTLWFKYTWMALGLNNFRIKDSLLLIVLLKSYVQLPIIGEMSHGRLRVGWRMIIQIVGGRSAI